VFDPLDGSSNNRRQRVVGTIFSVLRHENASAATADYLQPGRLQVAAGYAVYGPSTMFVVTVGQGTHGFTLDRESAFHPEHPNMEIPADTSEFAINTSNARFWSAGAPLRDGMPGRQDRRSRPRLQHAWIASMVRKCTAS